MPRPLSRTLPPLPAPAAASRSGTSALELAAVARTTLEVAAMPASLVVQLVLWPETLAAWARGHRIPSSVVYNALHRVKPYHRVRDELAERLDVSRAALDTLIDVEPPTPVSLRPPAPPDLACHSPTTGPPRRNGRSPLERKAVYRVEIDTAALPASLVVQLAIWPETLAGWARRESTSAALVYALLAKSQRADRVERALARRLGVAEGELRRLIEAERQEPVGRLPLLIPPASSAHTVPFRSRTARRPRPSGALPSGSQLTLRLDGS